MGERIHLRTMQALALLITVPTLPDGGCSVFHFISPARKLPLADENAGDVMMTIRRKRRQQRSGAEESGGHQVVVGPHKTCEMRRSGGFHLIRDEPEEKSHGIGGLIVHGERSVLLVINPPEGGRNLVGMGFP